jgi:phosphoribosylaminoimidazole (AIR) synthetase
LVLIVAPERVKDVEAMLTAGGETAFQIGVLKPA